MEFVAQDLRLDGRRPLQAFRPERRRRGEGKSQALDRLVAAEPALPAPACIERKRIGPREQREQRRPADDRRHPPAPRVSGQGQRGKRVGGAPAPDAHPEASENQQCADGTEPRPTRLQPAHEIAGGIGGARPG